jgi:resolvase-like protein
MTGNTPVTLHPPRRDGCTTSGSLWKPRSMPGFRRRTGSQHGTSFVPARVGLPDCPVRESQESRDACGVVALHVTPPRRSPAAEVDLSDGGRRLVWYQVAFKNYRATIADDESRNLPPQSRPRHRIRSGVDRAAGRVRSRPGRPADQCYRCCLPPRDGAVTHFHRRRHVGGLAIEDRPVLLDAVAALKRGDVLLVAKRDRLGRDVIAVAMIERLVAKRGARVTSPASFTKGPPLFPGLMAASICKKVDPSIFLMALIMPFVTVPCRPFGLPIAKMSIPTETSPSAAACCARARTPDSRRSTTTTGPSTSAGRRWRCCRRSTRT